MPYEPGGRAAKQGARYEDKWVVAQYLKLIREELASVCVEPLGVEEDGVDVKITHSNGEIEFAQCKGRNGTNEHWTVANLNSRGVLTKARNQLQRDPTAIFSFVSAVPCRNIGDICERARNTASAEVFFENQLGETQGDRTLQKIAQDFARYFEINMENADGRSQLHGLFSRSYFCLYPDDRNEETRTLSDISMLFDGNPKSIIALLSGYAVDERRMGADIHANELVVFLKAQGYHLRLLDRDDRILPRIIELNREFAEDFSAIDGKLFGRSAITSIVAELKNGNSVIMLGEPGAGKSGCVHNLIEQLKKESIPYLTIRLDKQIPEDNAQKYGRKLGLPASPIRCLKATSSQMNCVLILDQLDAIRWTVAHSASSLLVCKEMIREAMDLKLGERDISIVLVCRRFDYENDRGLQSLVEKEDAETIKKINWTKIAIEKLSLEEMKQLLGHSYGSLPSRIQELLRTPSNLAAWKQIDNHNNIESIYTLMRAWWDQILKKGLSHEIDALAFKNCKDAIVSHMANSGRLYIPESMVADNHTTDYLVASALLTNRRGKIAFAHQSYFDFFLVEKKIEELYQGRSILDLLEPYDQQTPHARYRLQMLLQQLLIMDEDDFLKKARVIMKAEDRVHYYFQCLIFEILGQAEEANADIIRFLKDYWESERWHKQILYSVFVGHPAFAMRFVKEGFAQCWLDGEGYHVLGSIRDLAPDFLFECLFPLVHQDQETDERIYSLLPYRVEEDSDQLFSLRMSLIEILPPSRILLHIHDLQKEAPIRFVSIVKLTLEKGFPLSNGEFDFSEKDFLPFCEKNAKLILAELLPTVINHTRDFTIWHDEKYRDWLSSKHYVHPYRGLVEIIKHAFSAYAHEDIKGTLQLIGEYDSTPSLIGHEIISAAIASLPDLQADYALQWLLKDLHKNAFISEHIGTERVFYSKTIIERFSRFCSDEMFCKLENAIANYHEADERELARHRFAYTTSDGVKYWVFWNYWGDLQKAFLPLLDQKRISPKGRDLLAVLERNPKISGIEAYTHYSTLGGWVGSSIGKKAEALSDKSWRKVLTYDFSSRRNRGWSHRRNGFCESSPMTFSQTLSSAIKKDPERFARLSLSLRKDAYQDYQNAFLEGLHFPLPTDNEEEKGYVNMALSLDVIKKNFNIQDRQSASRLVEAVQIRAEEPWPMEILQIIADIASQKTKYESDKNTIEDEKEISPFSIETCVINCTSGESFRAIASLLWQNQHLLPLFINAIESAVAGKNIVLHFAILNCVTATYNIDRDLSKKWFFALLRKDARILGAHDAWQLLSRFFIDDPELCESKLAELYYSDNKDFIEISASFACALYLYKGSNALRKLVYSESQTEAHIQGITSQAIHCLRYDDFRQEAKHVLMQYSSPEEIKHISTGELLKSKGIEPVRDRELFIHLATKGNSYQINRILEFLLDKDVDVTCLAEILLKICRTLHKKEFGYDSLMETLLLCIFRLFDHNSNNQSIRSQCLEMWDLIYMADNFKAKRLSHQLEKLQS